MIRRVAVLTRLGCLLALGSSIPAIFGQSLSVSGQSQVQAQLGKPWRLILEASGGTPPYAWTLASGVMPPGVTLSTRGIFSGTPSAAGSFVFEARVVDSLDHSATEHFVVAVSGSSGPEIVTPAELDYLQTGETGSYRLSSSGGEGPVSWAAEGGLPQGFSLTGNLLTGRFSAAGTQRIVIRATDSAGRSDLRIFTASASRVALVTAAVPAPQLGEPYSQLLTASGGIESYSWSVQSGSLPQGLTLSSNGLISGTPEAFNSERPCVRIAVADAGSQISIHRFCLAVQPPAGLSILTGNRDRNTLSLGESSQLQFEAAGGRSGRSWRVVAGSLPGGLSLDATGQLTGTAMEAGIFTPRLEVSDGQTMDQKTIELVVSPLRLQTRQLTMTAKITAELRLDVGGGGEPYQWSLPAGSVLPDGLSLSRDGVVSGIPLAEGRFRLQVRVDDANSASLIRDLVLEIRPPETQDTGAANALRPRTVGVAITSPSQLPLATNGSPYSVTLTASGTGPFTWSVPANNLPVGLTATTAGVISGTTPTGAGCGVYELFVQVTDATLNVASKTLALGVSCTSPGALNIFPSLFPETSQGVSFSNGVFANGGTPYYTFGISAGALPPGVSITTDEFGNGTVSGTPTSSGTYSFTVRVTDGAAHTASRPFSLTVSPLTITSSTFYSLTMNTAITPVTLAATGGSGPYTWSVAGAPLPAGLALTPAGVLSGTPAESGNIIVNIRATDSASHTRTVPFSFSIGSGTATTIGVFGTGAFGTAVGQSFHAAFIPSGGTPPYTWTVTQGSLPAGLLLLSGQDYTPALWGVPAVAGNYTFSLNVTDGSGGLGVHTVHLNISPLFDTNGDLTIGPPTLGTFYSRQFSVAGGTGPYTWTLASGSSMPPGLSVSLSGVVSGTPTIPGTSSFSLSVADNASHTATFTYSLSISPVSFTTASILPNATVNSSYSAAFAATGGITPYSFGYFVTSTTSPIWFSLSGSGDVTGTPFTGTGGEFDVTVTANDANLYSAQKKFSLFTLENPAAPLVILSQAGLAETSVGSLTAIALLANGGLPPYTWTLANGSLLPPGMSLPTGLSAPGQVNFGPFGAPGNTALVGYPSAPGLYTFTLQVTDTASHTASKAFTVVVSPVSIFNADLAATMGTAYAHTFVAVGGTSPYTWTVPAGSFLPAGLTLSAGGLLSGTPTENGSLTFILRAMDSLGNSRTVSEAIGIASATSCSVFFGTAPQLADGAINQPYSALLSVGGCGAATNITLASGALPPGLQIQSSSAQLLGVPTVAGNYTFALQATDSANNIGVRVFRLKVSGLTNTTFSVAPAVAGTAYSQAFTVTGGTAPYSWSVCSGSSLPAGLILGATGILSGTPTSVGAYSFSICVTDNAGGSLAITLSLRIGAIAITTPAALPNIVIGQAWSQTIAAAGGVPPYTWSLGAPNFSFLPSGLTLNVLTGAITGTTTCCAGDPFTIGITVTDSVGNTASKYFGGFELPVQTNPFAPSSFLNGALGTVPVGQPFSVSLSASANGPYTWAPAPGSAALPPGLSIVPDPQNPPGFMLAGVPITPGNFVFTLKLVDTANLSATQTFALTVSSLTDNQSPPDGTVGTPYTFSLLGAGGTAPYTWTRLPGYPLPAGLTLSAAGALAGTPTESGSFFLRLQLTDATGALSVVNKSIFISSGTNTPVFFGGPFPMPTGFVQQEYNVTFPFSGGTAPYTYSVTAGTLPPGLQLLPGSSANSISVWGEPTTAGTYSFTVKVTDSVGNTGYRTPVINVSPLANAVPSLPGGSLGLAYSQMLSVAGGTGPYAWSVLRGQYPLNLQCSGCNLTFQDSLLPPGLTLATSGALAGTPLSPGTFNFQVMAVDNAGNPLVIGYNIVITSLTISTPGALPAASVGTPYSAAFAAVGGLAPYTFVLPVTTQLPAGLAVAANGVISGTPTAAGIYSFGVNLTDSASNSYSKTFSMLVAPATIGPLVITWNGTAGFTTSNYLTPVASGAGVGINFAAGGGVGPYTWSVAPGFVLPRALTLTNTGNLIGLAEIPGVFSFGVRVTDSLGTVATQVFYLNVSPLKIYPNLPDGTVGTAYSTTLVAIGGTAPYQFSIGPGSTLPAGLTLNPATGLLSGSPTDTGAVSFNIRVSDANGLNFTRTVNLSIASGTSITYAISASSGTPLADARPQVPYSVTFSASGCCRNPVSFAWTLAPNSSLPAGLSLQGSTSSSIVLSGTPAAAGHYTFRIVATDDASNFGAHTFSLNVTPLVDASPAVAPCGVGLVCSQSVAVAGGNGPYTYTIAPGYALPSGFSLSSTSGTITGTPSAPAQYVVGVLVTDAGGNTIVIQTTITANVVSIGGPDLLPVARANTTYSTSLTASGGSPGYSWTVASGSLPSGLTLSSSGTISGTPSFAGLYTMTFVVLDSAFNETARTLALYVTSATPAPLSASVFSIVLTANATSQCCFTASGGTPPYNWSVNGGALPPGTQMLTDQSGRASLVGFSSYPGHYTARIQVTDANGVTASGISVITIGELANLPAGTVNTAYSAAIAMAGGTPPYQFALGPDAVLPAGMTLSASGVLAGTPADPGSQPFDIVITDAVGNVTYRNIGFTVNGTGNLTVSIPSSPSTGVVIRLRTVSQANLAFFGSGGAAPYAFTLAGGSTLPPGLTLTGNTISGAPTATGAFSTVLVATDANGVSGQRTLRFVIGPQFQISTGSFPVVQTGQPISLSLGAAGGTQPYTWSLPHTSLLPPGLGLSARGLVTGTPTLGGQYSFQAVVTDSSTPPNRLTGFFTLTVSPVVITTSGPLANATVGVHYSATFDAIGGTGPYTYFLPNTTAVPTGMTLSTSGTLSGTTSSLGSVTFTVNALDSRGWVVSSTFHMYVVAAPAPLPLLALPVALTPTTALTGTPISTLLPATGGTPPYTWSVATGSTLPPGLAIQQGGILPVPSFTPGDAILTGVVPTPGIYTFTLNVTDSAFPVVTASRTYQLVASSITATVVGTSGTVGTAMQANVLPAGGTGPYSVSVFSGALPKGLTLSGSGVISGTPVDPNSFNTLTAFFVTFKVSDSSSPALYGFTTAVFTVSTTAASTLRWSNSANLGVTSRNRSYSQALGASGGTSPYTFSLPQSSLLPPGLTLSGGSLTGTPSAAGKYTFAVTLIDAASVSFTRDFYLEVSTLAVTPVSLADATQATAYTANFSATGGTAPYSFTISSLPPGISLAADGTFSGTPGGSGLYSFTVTAYDSSVPANSTSASFTLNVAQQIVSGPGPGPGPGPVPTSSDSITVSPAPLTFTVRANEASTQSVTLTYKNLNRGTPAIQATTTSDFNWLTATVGPATFDSFDGTSYIYTATATIRADAAGFTQDHSLDGSVDFVSGGAQTTLRVTMQIVAPVKYTAAPQALDFSYEQGSAAQPSPQNISVTSLPTGASFTASASSADNWLSITGGAASPITTPGSITVAVDASKLQAGDYSGHVTITPASGTPITIAVRLKIVIPGVPQLSVSPLIQVFALSQTSQPATGQLVVVNTGGGTLHFTAVAGSDKNWLVLAGNGAGSVTPGLGQVVGYTVDPAGLAAGSYSGQIVMSDGTSVPTVVKVSLTVSATRSVVLSRGGLTFITSQGGPTPPAQNFSVYSEGAGSLGWTATSQVFYNPQLTLPSNPVWLTAAPATGSSEGGQPGVAIVVTANAAGLPPGQYYGAVTVTAPGAANSPESVSVMLSVAPPSAPQPPQIQIGTGGVILVGTAGSKSPRQQTITVFNPGTSAVRYSTSASAAGWLSVSPPTGSFAPGVNTLTIQADLTALTQGIQAGAVVITTANGAGEIQVDVIVTGSTAALRSARPEPKATPATCTSGKPGFLLSVFRQPVGRAAAQGAVAQAVQVLAYDSCGNPVTASAGGAVAVSFSNGDASINLADVGAGVWEGTWTPINSAQSVTLNAVSSQGAMVQSGADSVTVSMAPADSAAAAVVTGIANAAAGASSIAQLITPGSYIAIYGSNLADSACSDPAAAAALLPLQTTLNGTQVLVGNIAMPLLFACQTQINAVVPQGLGANALSQLIVVRDATRSVPQPVSVAGLQPGIYTVDSSGSGQGIAEVAGTTALATPARPVLRGVETLAVFATGLGPVHGPSGEAGPADGAAAPSTILLRTDATVTATIGGVPATVVFSGLTPTLAALYQVNVVVPDSAPAGDAVPLVITATDKTGAVFVSNTVAIAVH